MGAQAAALLAASTILGTPPPAAELPRTGRVSLGPVPSGLALDRVARSHAWCALAPYAYDRPAAMLHRGLEAPEAVAVRVHADWTADWAGAADAGQVRAQMRWCLGLDDDVDGAPDSVWAQRVLRSPTVWEDVVKAVLTTNTSFAAARGMVSRLAELGVDGAFPAPPAVLTAGAAYLRQVVRAGYRSDSLLALAERGQHLQELRALAAAGDVKALRAALLDLPGIGPLSAEHLMAMLGRPRGLPTDGWALRALGLSAHQAQQRYAAAGRWAGSALAADVASTWLGPVAGFATSR